MRSANLPGKASGVDGPSPPTPALVAMVATWPGYSRDHDLHALLLKSRRGSGGIGADLSLRMTRPTGSRPSGGPLRSTVFPCAKGEGLGGRRQQVQRPGMGDAHRALPGRGVQPGPRVRSKPRGGPPGTAVVSAPPSATISGTQHPGAAFRDADCAPRGLRKARVLHFQPSHR